MPLLYPQLRVLILTLCLRPSSKFAHLLRHLPPSATADVSLPLAPIAFPPAYPELTTLSFAHHLRRLSHFALAKSLRIDATTFTDAASDICDGTAFQLLLRASDGGVGFTDPALLATPSFLGSFADTLPTLSHDSFLAPILADPASWQHSASPVLRGAFDAFHQLAPLLADSITAPDTSCPHQTLRAHLTAPDLTLSIHLLANAAGRRPQHSFTHALFSHLVRHLLSPASSLSDLARARIRHAAIKPSPVLFQMYYIPQSSRLSDIGTIFLYCHRLGIRPPFLPSPMPKHCHPNCPYFARKRKPIPPAYRITFEHAYHQISCGATPRRHRKHDALVGIIADAVRTNLAATTERKRRLVSSLTAYTKTDLVITDHRRFPPILTLDARVSCPLLPSLLPAATRDAMALFANAALEKNIKHLAGCNDQGRAFLPIIFSSLGGIGPPETVSWLDSIFSESYAEERLRTGTVRNTSHRHTLFYQSLMATLVSSSADMASQLTAAGAVDDGDDEVDAAQPLR